MSLRDLLEDVIDQDSAVTQLHKSSQNPVHAYLFVGPKGSCKWDAAKAFAAMIMNHTNHDHSEERTANLIRKGEHPDLPDELITQEDANQAIGVLLNDIEQLLHHILLHLYLLLVYYLV